MSLLVGCGGVCAAPAPPFAGLPNGGYKVGDQADGGWRIYTIGVDADIVSAPPVGSAATIRFFIDHQRSSTGSFPAQDWPILLGEKAVSSAGAVVETQAPANVPLFEQLRSPAGTVPLTGGPTLMARRM